MSMTEKRGIFDGFVTTILESTIPPIVTRIFRDYSGPNCEDLRMGILLDTDLFKTWVDNEDESPMSLSRARTFAGMAGERGKRMFTCENIRKWILQEGYYDIINTIDCTPGGQRWFQRTVENFKQGLWP